MEQIVTLITSSCTGSCVTRMKSTVEVMHSWRRDASPVTGNPRGLNPDRAEPIHRLATLAIVRIAGRAGRAVVVNRVEAQGPRRGRRYVRRG